MILILKTGTSYKKIRTDYGDFEDWIVDKMGLEKAEYYVHSIGDYQHLPPEYNYKGVIITGSHAMVTDIELKSTAICDWLLHLQDKGIPVLGICYGHQLLCVLADGCVDYNPSGSIIGMENTYLTNSGQNDILLGSLPSVFEVYKAHKQSVIQRSKRAEILSVNSLGMIDAFRLNKTTWGVQFHPEFDQNVSKSYIEMHSSDLMDEGLNPKVLSQNVKDVDYGSQILKRFKAIAYND